MNSFETLVSLVTVQREKSGTKTALLFESESILPHEHQ